MVVLVHSKFAGLLEEIVNARLFEYSLEGVKAYYCAQPNFSLSVSEHNRVEFKRGDEFVLADRLGEGVKFAIWTHRDYKCGPSVVGVPMSKDVAFFDYFLNKCQLEGVGYACFALGLRKIGFEENRFGIDGEFRLGDPPNSSGLPVFVKFRFMQTQGRIEYKLSAELVVDKLPLDDSTKEIDVSAFRQSFLGFQP